MCSPTDPNTPFFPLEKTEEELEEDGGTTIGVSNFRTLSQIKEKAKARTTVPASPKMINPFLLFSGQSHVQWQCSAAGGAGDSEGILDNSNAFASHPTTKPLASALTTCDTSMGKTEQHRILRWYGEDIRSTISTHVFSICYSSTQSSNKQFRPTNQSMEGMAWNDTKWIDALPLEGRIPVQSCSYGWRYWRCKRRDKLNWSCTIAYGDQTRPNSTCSRNCSKQTQTFVKKLWKPV